LSSDAPGTSPERGAAEPSVEGTRTAALEPPLADARLAAAATERAVRGRDELLSLVSHDLRSALNAMVGWLYLARSPTAEAAARTRALEGIASAVDTQRRLVDQLQDAARLLGGRVPAECRPVHAAAVLQRVVARLAPHAADRSVALHVAASPDGLSFLADPSRVEDSLYAMVEHALALTPGQGIVHIGARPEVAQGKSMIALEVRSAGAGADAAAAQAAAPDGGLAASPTLALAIARAVTELQGGTLDVQAGPPGSGTHLSLRFPARDAMQAEAARVQPAPGPARTGFFDAAGGMDDPDDMDILRGCFILLTDNRDDMLEVGATVLRRHGAHVTTAGSGAESIALYPGWARGGGERLMISDLSMPDIDGLAMIGRIRRIEGESGLPRVPAVAFSAQADRYARPTVMQAGFDLFLAKPLSPAQLIGAISPLVGR
jgi:CheY-like chemotaxis protein